MWMNLFQVIYLKILDYLYPRNCEICSRPVDRRSRYICSDCLMRVPFAQVFGTCSVCSRPIYGYEGEFVCDECIRTKPHFDVAVQAVKFEGKARELVIDFKFNDAIYLKNDFADWMEGALRARLDVSAVDAVVPVPLTRKGFFRRGYNQSEILAREIALKIDRKCVRALARKGSPRTQSSLDAASRAENVKGTFAVVKPSRVRGRIILLIDDIMTTGSTLSECASVLKECGAAEVWCLTLASAQRN